MREYGVVDLAVRFGDRTALEDVTAVVARNTVLAVVGGDGSGKSTLLRALIGEVPVHEGDVLAPDLADVGYLPATAGSWAGLTARQNLEFAGGIHGLNGEARVARCTELLDRAGLLDAADRPASTLSGGMRRKLGLCMAMVHRPALLVLDEPTTGVDPVSRLDLWRLITQAAADGAAVMMTTTYLDEAQRAGSLVVLADGRMLATGTFDRIRDGIAGVVTRVDEDLYGTAPSDAPTWRRGRARHAYWAPGRTAHGTAVDVDLEDVVMVLSLRAEALA
jgi:ABC-2 type transport system ATP-binding protein